MPNSIGATNQAMYSQATKASADKTKSNDMSVDSFLQLLAAQLQNQDMMNPMKDTDFMGQLAQFTSLQIMQETNVITSTSYAISLVGKEATGATINNRGDLVAKTGTITGVSLFNGEPVFYIDDFGFYLSQLMNVGKIPEKKDPEGEEKPEQLPVIPETGDGDTTEIPEHLPVV